MAAFGDLGKLFGLGSTGDVAASVTGFFGGSQADQDRIKRRADEAAQVLSELGSDRPDVATSPQQAGVDSAATVLNVSQTGQLSPGGMGGRMGDNALAGFGLAGPLSQLIGRAPGFLSRPGVGGLIGGLGAGAAVDFFIDQFGQQKKLVITRKMQRDVKKLFMMSGGDFNMTAELYRMATGRSITGEQVVKIITKTFKNQGPYVTKAAVRKTRSTIRKMETLCDLKDRLAPPKRRAPARRRTMSTSITQVK